MNNLNEFPHSQEYKDEATITLEQNPHSSKAQVIIYYAFT